MTRPALLIFTLDVHRLEPYSAYEAEAASLLGSFGGEVLAATSALLLEDGRWPRQRVVIYQFPSRDQAQAYYRSPAYERLTPARLQASDGDVILAESPGERAPQSPAGNGPAHYILGGVTVTDPGWLGEYMRRVPAVSARFGVEGLVMGNDFTVLEGSWSQTSAVLLRLPSKQSFEGFWRGEDYRPMKELREANTQGDHISFAGVIDPAG